LRLCLTNLTWTKSVWNKFYQKITTVIIIIIIIAINIITHIRIFIIFTIAEIKKLTWLGFNPVTICAEVQHIRHELN